MSRWKAAAIHSLLSLLAGGLVFGLLFGLWFPPPYFHAAGADKLVLLLFGIDLTLGPLLTLIIFKSGKRGLKFDLTVIAVLQAAALVYGLHVITGTRPVFLVGAIDRFNLVSAKDIEAADLAEARHAQFRRLSWTGALLVATKRPDDPAERTKLLFSGLEGKDLERLPKYYVPYEEGVQSLLERAQPLDKLRPKDADVDAEVNAWLARNGRSRDDVVWLPVMARNASLTMLMDKRSGQPLGALDIDPW
ncbi:TfpX/TfpZ family type IV pilin accessory protein [Tahibacter harae]|uniref:Type IV pilin accessory protein n=1 Tax=Tahibacter harae TaxID=2963937 RepID=A0ABT1QQ45_9GAMM|nr:TfpX/TfpZ family type IV pilin accessory protein [Tahibacter harae]MCQ4164420.1 hypothetical protein [Tahibacter harae]